MGRGKKSGLKGPDTPAKSPSTVDRRSNESFRSDASNKRKKSLRQWLARDARGLVWVMGCVVLGGLTGFLLGTGSLEFSSEVKPWRRILGSRVRSTKLYRSLALQREAWDRFRARFSDWAARLERDIEVEIYAANPSHPRVFAVLREAVIREKGGYVHPDLGFLVPAPCGAARGIGMVRDSYHQCQARCLPGLAEEKLKVKKEKLKHKANNEVYPIPNATLYHQEEILIYVPLSFQMTRTVAINVLSSLIPVDVQRKTGMTDLDDSMFLVLLLAHERGVGRFSRWMPYIASLPPEPSCGYSKNLRPAILDAIAAYRYELGVQTEGWPEELLRAQQYAHRIAETLSRDYGHYLQVPPGTTSLENIAWALCQVASRATSASEKYGSLRMIPVLDQINHDADAGDFVELTGKERLKYGDFVDASEDDSGAFVVRSFRHEQRKPLRKGQELLANYNVPHYTPLDWMVSMAFVPPERQGPWLKLAPAFPRVRPFPQNAQSKDQMGNKDSSVLKESKSRDL